MSKPLIVDIASCGLSGPGLLEWQAARSILCGEQAYQTEDMEKPSVKHLPARDRRRFTFAIALAITTAMKAVTLEGKEQIPAVFACSGGDTDVINRLCTTLTLPGCPVSPQQFVNSVHNAPAGYWSIAEENYAPTMSLSAFDATFASGLLEAAVQIRSGCERVLLIAYDVPAPPPIWSFRPLSAPFAVALLLAAPNHDKAAMARLELELVRDQAETSLDVGDLESLRLGNPAARSLPLLQALAGDQPQELVLPYLSPQSLGVCLTPNA
ncbi:MAG: beta-ketoacyl synthase chain length factor [Geminicoccales bacterium]